MRCRKRGERKKAMGNRHFRCDRRGTSRRGFLEAAHDVSYDIVFAGDVGDVEVEVLNPLEPANLARGGMGHFLEMTETRVVGLDIGGCAWR